MWRIVVAVVQMGRLYFLIGGALMFFVGVSFGQSPTGWHLASALAMVLLAQVTAHYVNEYADYEADSAIRNRTAFSGGSGVLVTGAIPRRWALRVAVVTSALSLLSAVVVAVASPFAALMGAVALGVSWAYSMPPVRLLSTGGGELATAVTIGGLVPAIGATIAGGPLPGAFAWTLGAFVLVYLVMLLAFELPDLATDVLSGKRVLAIRIGPDATLALMSALVIGTAVLSVVAGSWALLLTSVPLGVVATVLSKRRCFAISTLSAVAAPAVGAVALLVVAS